MQIELTPFEWAYDSKGYVLSEDGATVHRAGGELVRYDPVTRFESGGDSYGAWRLGELPLAVRRRRERLGKPGQFRGEIPPLHHQIAPGGRFDFRYDARTKLPARVDRELLAELYGPSPGAPIRTLGIDTALRDPRETALAVLTEIGPLGYAGQRADADSEPFDWFLRELFELRAALAHLEFARRLTTDGKAAPFQFSDESRAALNAALSKRRFHLEAGADGVVLLRPRTLLEFLWSQVLLDVSAGVGFHRCEFSRCQRPIPVRTGDGRVAGLQFCSVAHRVAHGRELAKRAAAVVGSDNQEAV